MPFNFPIAQNNFGQLFAQGIANAIGQYQQQRALRRQAVLDEQGKALQEFQNPGFHFGEPPKTLPTDQIEVATPSPDAVSNFQQGITGALLPRVTGKSPSIVPFSGGYYDPEEAMARLRPQMMMTAQGEYLKSQAGAAGKAAGDPSEVALRDAQRRLAERNISTPRLGDPNYAPAMGAVAGAQASARVGPAIQQALGIAQGELPIKKDLAAYTSGLTEGREGRLLDKRITAERTRPTLMFSAAKQFASENSKLVQGVDNYAQVKTAINEARQGNPAALKSALLSFASVADPKAQLRQGVMHEVMQVDPSFKGTFEMWLDKRANGQIPPRILNSMERMVDAIHHTNASIYEQRRQEFLSRNPEAATFVAPTEALFNVPGVARNSAPRNPYR